MLNYFNKASKFDLKEIIYQITHLSILKKAVLNGLLIILLFSIIVFFKFIPIIEEEKLEERQGKLKAVVNSAISLMAYYEQILRTEEEVKSDLLQPKTIEKAKELIIQNFRQMRYDKTEHFFIMNGSGKMIMHPLKPELEGKSVLDIQDDKGNYIFRDMVLCSQRDSECFSKYIWQSKYSPVVFEPQMTYSKYFWQWDWIVSSAIYTQDIDNSIKELRFKSIIYTLITLFVTIVILLLFVYYNLNLPLTNLLRGIAEVTQNNLDHTVPIVHNDELGFITYQFNQMVQSRKKTLAMIIQKEKEYNEVLQNMNASLEQKVQERTGELQKSLTYNADLLNETEKQKAIAEKAKTEIEKLNTITKKINSTSNIDEILSMVLSFLEKNFQLDSYWLLLVDKSTSEVYTFKVGGEKDYPPESIEFLKTFRYPLETELGSLYASYSKKKLIYMPKIIGYKSLRKIDKKIIDHLQLNMFLQVPLIVQDDVIGIFTLTSRKSKVKYTREDCASIQRFCEQISGVIHNMNLLNETIEAHQAAEEQRVKAEEFTKIVEKARYEFETLNEVSKKINSTTDIYMIIREIFDFLFVYYEIDSYWLLLVNEKTNELQTHSYHYSDQLTKESERFIFEFRHPLNEELGSLYKTYKRKRLFYIPKIRMFHKDFRKIDMLVVKLFKLKALVQVPLIVRNKVIGIICLTRRYGKLELSPKALASVERFSEQMASAINNSILLSQLKTEKEKSETLLLNILPSKVAEELKSEGKVEPVFYESVSVLFTDFKGFTKVVEDMSVEELIKKLDSCFFRFDEIAKKHNLEKLKTIGDSYMCAGGLPNPNKTHPVDICLAALEIQSFMEKLKDMTTFVGMPSWELRLGINTGSVMAGVVGKHKFAYDIWGDAVNIASRMETGGEVGKINISGDTYQKVKYFFVTEYRGKIQAKNKGELDMYFLYRLKKKFSANKEGTIPNNEFLKIYEKIKRGGKVLPQKVTANSKKSLLPSGV